MNDYLKPGYLFGITGGVLCGLAFLLTHLMGKDPVSFTELFGYLLIPVFVFMGMKHFRDNLRGGALTFAQGMTVGFFIYSILAIISALVIFIVLHMDTAIFERFKAANLALLEEKKSVLIEQLSQVSYERTLNNIANMTILDVVFNDFLRKVIPGLFFTIIISLILKRSKK